MAQGPRSNGDALAQLRVPARVLATLGLAFASLFLVTGDDGAPGGPLFALLLIFACASFGGLLAARAKLPPLLGMLCAGLLLRSLPFVGDRVGARMDPAWSSAIRLLALALILLRAGLAFDLAALRRLMGVVLRLAALPCLAEAATVFALATWLLDFPPAWSAMLGFVVAPISPAVVVPGLLSLQERGFGTNTGIPTMVLAAAPLDDVLSIAGFGICLSFGAPRDAAGGSGSGDLAWMDFARAPLELVVGLASGAIGAGIIAALSKPPTSPPPAAAEAQDTAASTTDRIALLVGLATTGAFGLRRAGLAGASALAVLALAAGSAAVWGPGATRPVSANLASAWNRFAQPLLFGLVGSAIEVGALEPRAVGLGLGILCCSLTVRCCVAFLAVAGRGLRWQERFFTAVAWLPKATVQAAIGGIALDEAQDEVQRRMGRDILAIAVLAILATAPLGAVAISALGPRLLVRSENTSGKEAPEETTKEAKTEAKLNEEQEGSARRGDEEAPQAVAVAASAAVPPRVGDAFTPVAPSDGGGKGGAEGERSSFRRWRWLGRWGCSWV